MSFDPMTDPVNAEDDLVEIAAKAIHAGDAYLSTRQARQAARNAIAALEAVRSTRDGEIERWQPIVSDWQGPPYEHGVTWGDDAPRDGSDLQLFVESTGEQFIGYWQNGAWVYALHRGTEIVCEPTHWQPLPDPPRQALNQGTDNVSA